MDNAISLLLPDRLVRHNGPSFLTVNLMEQPDKNRILIHLLSYVPIRKSAEIDIIEERTVLRNVQLDLNLEKEIKTARVVPEDIKLEYSGESVVVPEINGYTIVELVV